MMTERITKALFCALAMMVVWVFGGIILSLYVEAECRDLGYNAGGVTPAYTMQCWTDPQPPRIVKVSLAEARRQPVGVPRAEERR